MVSRINLILKAKNISARQFAEEIGVQPSGMSHILSGRNNPSLDFVMKVIRRYPEIDINWLMFGKGEMYESPASRPVTPSPTPSVSVSPFDSASKNIPQPESNISQPTTNPTQISKSGQMGMESLAGNNPIGNSQRNTQLPPAPNSVRHADQQMDLFSIPQDTVREPSVYQQEPIPQPIQSNRMQDVSTAPVQAPISQLSMAGNSQAPIQQQSQSEMSAMASLLSATPTVPHRKLVRLLAFYDDQTFVEYRPQ